MSDAILALVALAGMFVTFLGGGLMAMLWSKASDTARRLDQLSDEHGQSEARTRQQLHHAWREVTELRAQLQALKTSRTVVAPPTDTAAGAPSDPVLAQAAHADLPNETQAPDATDPLAARAPTGTPGKRHAA